LAHKLNAPILLTTKNTLSAEVKTQLKNQKPKKIIILGGKGAISANTEKEIKQLFAGTIQRIAGADRFETAELIAKELGGSPDKAILAYGYNFPDALSAASYAAQKGYPIVLTNKDSLPQSSSRVLKGKKETIVVGGEAVISMKVTSKLSGVNRIYGKGRFGTSANIVKKLGMNTDRVFVANGFGFADALSGSVLAAKMNALLLLVEKDRLPSEISQLVKEKHVAHYTVLGGKAVVSDGVIHTLGKIRR
jgi:putative cell wall-binding protein